MIFFNNFKIKGYTGHLQGSYQSIPRNAYWERYGYFFIKWEWQRFGIDIYNNEIFVRDNLHKNWGAL